MPTYRYRRADGSTFEKLQKFSDAPLTADPETGDPVERVISGGAGLQFKGTGFYLTDYVKKSGVPASGESGGSDSSSEKAAPAAKAKPKTESSSTPAASGD